MRTASKILATITGNFFLALGSLTMAVLTILVSVLPPPGRWPRLTMRLWAKGVLVSSGIRVVVDHAAPLDPAARYVYLCNHQSLYDIPVLLATLPGSARMVAKRSLFRIPIFGWALTAAGFVAVDREDRSSARDTFTLAESRLRQGISLLVFPEGTRSTSDRLLPFQRGGFLLALKAGVPIVPVGIRGTRSIQVRGSRVIHPGTAEVRYGEPIDPAAFGVRRKGALVAEVRSQVAQLAGLASTDEPVSPAAEPA